MTSYLTEIYPLSVQNPSFKNKTSIDKRLSKKEYVSAPQFKYQSNFEKKYIEEVRRLLTAERANQNEEDFKFWTSDYERIMVDDWLVTRFLLRGLRASQKANQKEQNSIFVHTLNLIKSCAKFRHDYNINGNTSINEFPKDWIEVNGLFNYKPDLVGNPTIYLRIKLHKPNLIESKELRLKFKRFLLYHLEKCDQDLFNNPGKGVCCIFDMSEATFENIDLDLMSWMIKSFKSCSPKLLCYVIIYNLPWFFSATFKLISNTLMSNSNKQCLKFVYGDEIFNYIDHSNLPTYKEVAK